MEQMPSWPVIAGGAVFIVLAAVAWWWWPKWEVNRLRLKIRDPKARADVEDNFRKTIDQLLGGFAVLVGAGFATTRRNGPCRRRMTYSSANRSRRASSNSATPHRW
jgi:hypothetical protein